ncbi:MAG: 3,4-dihydroxy-2-butanone-4-phosphate synthase [Pseudomonadota bacterium]
MNCVTHPMIQEALADVISPIEEIIEDARRGQMFILIDEEDRENEGDLVIPAQMATPQVINFMAKHGRGLICLSLRHERVEALGLPMMAKNNSSRHETAFTVSIEAREGVTTGISAYDRARTIAVAIDADKGTADIATPGHVFPLCARDGGVLVRAGHTEAAVDIARLAGLTPAGVICEIMNEDGTMARLHDLVSYARRHQLKIGTISDLIAFRRRNDNLVRISDRRTVESAYGGSWELLVFTDQINGAEHLALVKGDIADGKPVLTRIHALDPMRDVLGLCGLASLEETARAMELVAEEGRGVVVLLRDLTMKMGAPPTSSAEAPTDEPRPLRHYGLGAQVLSSLGLSKLTLLTNSSAPHAIGLDAHGLEIVGTRPIDGVSTHRRDQASD